METALQILAVFILFDLLAALILIGLVGVLDFDSRRMNEFLSDHCWAR